MNNNDDDDEEINTINIHFLLEMKNSVQRQNEYIYYLKEEIDNNNNFYKQLTTINNTITVNPMNDSCFVKLIGKKVNNDKIIKEINNILNDTCKHDIVEDYIETGVERDMLKILFCSKCNLTM